MSFYEDRILPHLTNLAMRNRTLVPYRQRVLSVAEGQVLEIGIGSGLNLPFYGPDAREVIGLDPSPRLIAMAERAAQRGGRDRSDKVRRRISGSPAGSVVRCRLRASRRAGVAQPERGPQTAVVFMPPPAAAARRSRPGDRKSVV